MFQVNCLTVVLVCIVAGGNCEVMDIGTEVGMALEELNEQLLAKGKTSVVTEPGKLNDNISYSKGLLVGLNSMVGTGNCQLIRNSTATTYDLHIGFRLLSIFLPSIEMMVQSMSGYFRIRVNSFHVRMNILDEGGCHVNIESMKMIAAALVENGASVKTLDDLRLDSFFQKYVFPKINEILKEYKPLVEKRLQKNCGALRRFEKMDLSPFFY